MTGTLDLGMSTETVWVFGVTRPDAVLPTRADGGPAVGLVPSGPVAAVVAAHDPDRPVGAADLRAHAQVLDEIAAHHPVVPVRFGTVLPGDRVVPDLLLAQEASLSDRLDSLEGMVQWNVRVRYRREVVLADVMGEDPAIAELSLRTRDLADGSGYREKLRLGELVSQAWEARRERDADRLSATISRWADQVRPRTTGEDDVVHLALLVGAGEREALEANLEALAADTHREMTVSLAGPVAAYDFV